MKAILTFYLKEVSELLPVNVPSSYDNCDGVLVKDNSAAERKSKT